MGSKHRRPVTHLAQALHLAEDARSAFGKPQAPCEAAATCSHRARASCLRPCLPPGSTRACAEKQPWGTYWRATSAARDAQKASKSFAPMTRAVGRSRACGARSGSQPFHTELPGERNMSALGVDKAERKRRLGLLRIRGRQNPQTRSPQTRTVGRGEKRVLAGDGGYGSGGVDRRRRRIPGREAISRGQGTKRGEKESKRHHSSVQQHNRLSTYPLIPQDFPTGYVS